jgi:hypothetical protein
MRITKCALAMAAGVIALLSPRPASADQLLGVTGTFTDGSTLSGTITIDTTTGNPTGIDLTWSSLATPFFTQVPMNGAADGFPETQILDPSGTDELVLIWNTIPPLGTSSVALCSVDAPCMYNGETFTTLITTSVGSLSLAEGKIEPVEAPESASFVLLSTGLLGLALTVWVGKKAKPATAGLH